MTDWLTVTVGDRVLIGSGTIVKNRSDLIVMQPFLSDPDYRVAFDVKIEDGSEQPSLIMNWTQPPYMLTFTRAWAGGGSMAYDDLELGRLKDLRTSINFSVDFIGSAERHVVVFNFSLFEGPLK